MELSVRVQVPNASHSYKTIRMSLSEAKQKLLELEESGNFVFHGSGFKISEFEPRQACNYINGKQIPDGKPAVFASSAVEYAIFMAIINKINCPKGCRSSAGGMAGALRFRATKETLEQVSEQASGWVYYFDKDTFEPRSEQESEFVSYDRAAPVGKIKVLKTDLPDSIELI